MIGHSPPSMVRSKMVISGHDDYIFVTSRRAALPPNRRARLKPIIFNTL